MLKKPTFTQFYAIFSLINVQKYFAWLSFRSFPAGMPIFSQIRVGHVTWGPHFGDSLVHPLLRIKSPLLLPQGCGAFYNKQEVRFQIMISMNNLSRVHVKHFKLRRLRMYGLFMVDQNRVPILLEGNK